MSTIEQTMRALTVPAWGADEPLRETHLPRPVPGPTEVLVAVRAAGVNPVDWKSRASGGFGMWDEPAILGWDVSGVVAEVGPGSTLFAVGDEVFGMPRFPRQAGAYAEYVVAPARQLAPKPAALSHVEAAALPLVGLTAWQALAEVAHVQPGERVLVHAAAGGLGHVAVQIARALGASVVGTASAGKHALLRRLGVDEPIDYTAVDFVTATAPVDVVLDTIGGDYARRSLALLRDGGRLVSITGPDAPGAEVEAAAAARGIRTGWTVVEPDRHGLLQLARLVDEGRLRPEIAAVLPLAEADRAHQLGATNRTAGKIVLEVGDGDR
ncbi:NADP-dependent oxidoreductase [Patulibacter defluvii]|uniref:NADP-dependent oxidoreductase n=1 Tax=Patulibacter defluvii TaxID=3095358 RepID=UPI002A7585E8|nr:NADP-dependent oxidoreductase [Patulibacter sp. DM4]